MLTSAFAVTNVQKLKIAGNSYTDETVIRFLQGASPDFDGSYDAWKLFSGNPNVPSLFTKCPSGELSINALPLMQSDTSVELFVVVPAQGTYTITGQEYGIFDNGCCIMLEDLQTGNYFDLRTGTSYPFTLNISSVNSPPRFKVHFRVPAIITTLDASCFGYNNGSVLIQNNGIINWSYSFTDSIGNGISSGSFTQNANIQNLIAGNYQLITSDATGCARTHSIIISQPSVSVIADFTVSDTLVNAGSTVQFSNLSTSAISYQWDFGDGSPLSGLANPSHSYMAPGIFTISLVADNGTCSASLSKTIQVMAPTGISSTANAGAITAILDGNNIAISNNGSESGVITVYDLVGNIVFTSLSEPGEKNTFDLNSASNGLYIICFSAKSSNSVIKLYY